MMPAARKLPTSAGSSRCKIMQRIGVVPWNGKRGSWLWIQTAHVVVDISTVHVGPTELAVVRNLGWLSRQNNLSRRKFRIVSR
jgi:hypothetical protein